MAGIPLRHAPLVVASAAVATRVLYLIQIRASPLFDYLHLDPLYYVEWGRRVAGGAWLGDQVFEQSPLYPYLLGAFFSLFGDGDGSLLLLRLLQLKKGWTRRQMGLLASQRIPLSAKFKQAKEDDASAVTFSSLGSRNFCELKEGILNLLSERN